VPPGRPIAENFWHTPKYLPIPIILKFQLRSSINVQVTESCLCNRFALKSPPKWGFALILGVGAMIFGGKVHPSSKLHVFRHLLSISDAPCTSILYGYSENLGKFGALQLPYQKSQENAAALRHPFGPSTTTWKNRNYSAM